MTGLGNEHEIIEHLMDLKADMAVVKSHTSIASTQIDRHNDRISNLEKWRWIVLGIAMAIGFFLPTAGESIARMVTQQHNTTP